MTEGELNLLKQLLIKFHGVYQDDYPITAESVESVIHTINDIKENK